MKTINDETYIDENNYRIKTIRTVTKMINGCSLRRAKKKAVGLHLRGTHKKNNPKWVGYDSRASYSRRNRRFFIINKYTLYNKEK